MRSATSSDTTDDACPYFISPDHPAPDRIIRLVIKMLRARPDTRSRSRGGPGRSGVLAVMPSRLPPAVAVRASGSPARPGGGPRPERHEVLVDERHDAVEQDQDGRPGLDAALDGELADDRDLADEEEERAALVDSRRVSGAVRVGRAAMRHSHPSPLRLCYVRPWVVSRLVPPRTARGDGRRAGDNPPPPFEETHRSACPGG